MIFISIVDWSAIAFLPRRRPMSLKPLLAPQSIAVIGASREPQKVGHRVFRNLVDFKFKGALFPVNPKADEILGLRCYPSIRDVPGPVDMAVICVPARIVPAVARECGEKGVRSLVVISAGFSEIGREGAELERRLTSVCRTYGMRMQGPNCLGIINAHVRVNASFAPTNPMPGGVAFVSQSGALGSSILNWALQKGIGFSIFASLGNEADIDSADFLEALSMDERTRVIALYMEGVKNGSKFLESAARAVRRKPVVALKAGTTDVGMRAVSSHTGSLAGSDAAFSAAFEKSGVIRVATLEELFALILAFEAQPIPRSRNVLIVTNGGGPGILAADACEKTGLELPLLEKPLIERLRAELPPQASFHNPLDVLGDADDARYRLALDIALQSENVDSVIVVVTPQAMTPSERIARVVADASRAGKKPIIGAFMGYDESSRTIRALREGRVPNYEFPEQAAFVIANMCRYGEKVAEKEQPEMPSLSFDDLRIESIVKGARGEGRATLTVQESISLAEAAGIPVPRSRLCTSGEEAAKTSAEIGFPVALKIVSPEIVHKTDLGGVALGLGSPEDVRRAFNEMLRRARLSMPGAAIHGVLVQKMCRPGREVIIGGVRDPSFGPLIMFGLGGIYVDFLRDVAYGLAPMSEREARDMIGKTKAYTLLRGVRGEQPSDIDSVVRSILRVSQLMHEFDDIMEFEINPLFVYPDGEGCLAVDVRVTISKSDRGDEKR